MSDEADQICGHCKKKGHQVDSCFKLHGFPEWWPPGNDRGRGSNRGRGGNRGGRGGRGTDGKGSGQTAAAHAVTTGDGGLSSLPDFENLTPSQWDTIRHALSVSFTPSVPPEKLTGIAPRWI
ncbi:hypothetical protein DM860_017805 [Cuscuta australis]|uniref:Retrotransposon Copia-like N-terminal domain-containing protein n=1 Tax=Cuscuta australis TaxID=267555 RepID=A0A328DU41_9ASTE|nr:hypothetical protein DM860_017805 [Cuscuta australis]